MKKLFLSAFICVICGQLWAVNFVGVYTTTNGALLAPTNFFKANSNLLNAVVAATGGGSISTNGLASTGYVASALAPLASTNYVNIIAATVSAASLTNPIPAANVTAGNLPSTVTNTAPVAGANVTGVLPAGTVSSSTMIAGEILGNDGTNRVWTNSIGALTTTSLTVTGTNTAGYFVGNGAGLTNLQVTGDITNVGSLHATGSVTAASALFTNDVTAGGISLTNLNAQIGYETNKAATNLTAQLAAFIPITNGTAVGLTLIGTTVNINAVILSGGGGGANNADGYYTTLNTSGLDYPTIYYARTDGAYTLRFEVFKWYLYQNSSRRARCDGDTLDTTNWASVGAGYTPPLISAYGNGTYATGNLTVTGTNTAGYFVGNGAGLTNISHATNADTAIIAATVSAASLTNTIPAANVTAGNLPSTVTNTAPVAGANVTGVLPAGTVSSSTMISGKILGNDGTNRVWTNSIGALTTTSLTVTGTNTAGYFVGNGGGLTNLQVTSGITNIPRVSSVPLYIYGAGANALQDNAQACDIRWAPTVSATQGGLLAAQTSLFTGTMGTNFVWYIPVYSTNSPVVLSLNFYYRTNGQACHPAQTDTTRTVVVSNVTTLYFTNTIFPATNLTTFVLNIYNNGTNIFWVSPSSCGLTNY